MTSKYERKEPWGSPGHVIRKMYDRSARRLRWYAWTDDMKILSIHDRREDARAARRSYRARKKKDDKT